MNVDGAILEQIVKSVVSKLASDNGTVRHSSSGTLVLEEKVLTEDCLEKSCNGTTALQIGQKTVLTPSALDFLRRQGITWSRKSNGTQAKSVSKATQWRAFVVEGTSSLNQLLAERMEQKPEIWSVTNLEATEDIAASAMKTLLEKKSAGAVVFLEAAELLACRVNRNENIWAASARTPQDIERIQSQMNVNLWAVSPKGSSYMELRNILRRIEK